MTFAETPAGLFDRNLLQCTCFRFFNDALSSGPKLCDKSTKWVEFESHLAGLRYGTRDFWVLISADIILFGPGPAHTVLSTRNKFGLPLSQSISCGRCHNKKAEVRDYMESCTDNTATPQVGEGWPVKRGVFQEGVFNLRARCRSRPCFK